MDYESKNTEFRNNLNKFIEECKTAINNEQLIAEINNYFVQCFATNQLDNVFYNNKFIDNIAARSRDFFNHTIDSLALWCEFYFDHLYILKKVQAYNLDEQKLDLMYGLFLNKPSAMNACSGITNKREQEELFVAAIFNLMQSFKTNGPIPEYVLEAYRYSKKGYSYAEIYFPIKIERNKKQDKIFAEQATSLYEIILGQGYSKITKTNGFWGRAFSGGKQKATYNVYHVASHFAMGARFAQAKCKIIFPFRSEYNLIFEQVISPFLDLDKLFSRVNNFINYEMNVEDSLQKLLNYSWFDSGMLGVRANMQYQQQSQNANLLVNDMQSMASFVHGALMQANSWGVDRGPKSEIYSTFIRLLK